MPALLWVAFWSNVMGMTMAWQETLLPGRVQAKDRRDHHALEKSE